MAFRPANLARLAKFNSATSMNFLESYEKFVDNKILAEESEPSSRTFAPSSFRCDRKCWFRLRGVDPDVPKTPDRVLNFTAQIGTACHHIIQQNLVDALGDDWIDVGDYMFSQGIPFKYTLTKEGFETQVEITEPFPMRFAVDGIIRIDGEIYLLEIKSSEYSSFDELLEPKPHHVDQIKAYASLLNIHNVLVLYVDRQYGNLKVYEMQISDADVDAVFTKIDRVMSMVESCIAPDRLPKGDNWCSFCEYRVKCNQWGG